MVIPAIAIETIPQIGRLNYAGYKSRGHCSISLIGKNLALTARHCVTKWKQKDLRIVFGYARGDWVELHRVRSIWQHPQKDIALLCLAKTSQLKPLQLHSPEITARPKNVKVTGYRRGRPHLQSTLSCAAQKQRHRLRIECPAEPGMSGSPVFRQGKISAVMSQTANAFSLADTISDIKLNICK